MLTTQTKHLHLTLSPHAHTCIYSSLHVSISTAMHLYMHIFVSVSVNAKEIGRVLFERLDDRFGPCAFAYKSINKFRKMKRHYQRQRQRRRQQRRQQRRRDVSCPNEHCDVATLPPAQQLQLQFNCNSQLKLAQEATTQCFRPCA